MIDSKRQSIIPIQIEDDHPEAMARRAMFAAWKNLDRDKRPRNPRVLASLMIDCFVAPQLDFALTPSRRFDLEQLADVGLRNMRSAASSLCGELGRSRSVHALLSLMEQRLPLDDTREEVAEKLVAIEGAIRTIAGAPVLRPRRVGERPAMVRDPFVRAMIQAVHWYVDRFDRERSARLLSEVTVTALVRCHKSLARHIEEVRKRDEWRQPSFGWWDNYPDFAPRAAA